MKSILLVLGVILLSGGIARAGSRAVGDRNASGAPVGDFKIVGDAGNTQAEGKFKDGKMDGTWRFFDSHHVKIAEVNYQDGVPAGKFQTFFGSRLNPAAAGKLESDGRIQDGKIVGSHRAYDDSGKVFSEAAFAKGKLQSAKIGSNDAATQTAEADIKLIQTIEGIVRTAIK